MTPHQLVAVGARLLALFMVITVIWNMPYWLLNTDWASQRVPSGVFVVGIVFTLLLAYGIWKFPFTIAKGVLGPPSDPVEGRYEANDWFTVGCALIGIWFLADAASVFAANVIMAFVIEPGTGQHWPVGTWLGLYLPQALIGAWLLFGAQGWTRLLWTIRGAGRAAPPSE